MTGLGELQALLDDAAMPVSVARDGEPRRLPAVVDRSAYRVVRDSLAAAECATAARVAIRYVPGALVVRVVADGRQGRPLDEVAELAAALGGGLTTAPERGGFRVQAWLPTEDQPPSRATPPAAP
jgi:signal transduction histidine kinase